MNYPTKEEIFQWYNDIDTPQNIIDHVIMVHKIAMFLANELSKKGVDIQLKLVDAASLLHDLDKWLCIQKINKKPHGFETENILKKKGYPKIGYFARQHRSDLIVKGLDTWEEKIISYADRRVVHDKLVSMDERFDYINKKYPVLDGEDRPLIEKCYKELEEEIFSYLDIEPALLKNYIA